MTIEHPAGSRIPPSRGGFLGNRSFAVIAFGLPTLIVILVVIAWWDPPHFSSIGHDHGGNQVHSHWHTHDVGISHDHSHPGITRIEHSHRHEHGHLHALSIQPQLGGNLIPLGHTHQGSETRNYYAELRTDGNYLVLNFWLEVGGEIAAIRPAVDQLDGTLLEQYRARGALSFRRLGDSYIALRSSDQVEVPNPAVAWRGVALEGGWYEFKIAIPESSTRAAKPTSDSVAE